MQLPKVLRYLDYAEYLKDFYQYKKSSQRSFSHRAFLRKAGIAGPIYLHRVMNKQRKLSRRYIANFNHALGHSPSEAKYFQTLVQFRNERNLARKQALFQELLVMRSASKEMKIEDARLLFFDKWYYPVIRELAPILDFKEDYKVLANHLIPKITPDQAEQAVRYLVRNKFLKISRTGRYHQTDAVISTGPEVNSTIVKNYHKQVLQLFADAVGNLDREDREFSSITLSISPSTYHSLVEDMRAFRKQVMRVASEDRKPSLVFTMGLQLVPRTRILEEE